MPLSFPHGQHQQQAATQLPCATIEAIGLHSVASNSLKDAFFGCDSEELVLADICFGTLSVQKINNKSRVYLLHPQSDTELCELISRYVVDLIARNIYIVSEIHPEVTSKESEKQLTIAACMIAGEILPVKDIASNKKADLNNECLAIASQVSSACSLLPEPATCQDFFGFIEEPAALKASFYSLCTAKETVEINKEHKQLCNGAFLVIADQYLCKYKADYRTVFDFIQQEKKTLLQQEFAKISITHSDYDKLLHDYYYSSPVYQLLCNCRHDLQQLTKVVSVKHEVDILEEINAFTQQLKKDLFLLVRASILLECNFSRKPNRDELCLKNVTLLSIIAKSDEIVTGSQAALALGSFRALQSGLAVTADSPQIDLLTLCIIFSDPDNYRQDYRLELHESIDQAIFIAQAKDNANELIVLVNHLYDEVFGAVQHWLTLK